MKQEQGGSVTHKFFLLCSDHVANQETSSVDEMSSTSSPLCQLGSPQPQSKFNLLSGDVAQHLGGPRQRKSYFTRMLWSLDAVIERGYAEGSLSL